MNITGKQWMSIAVAILSHTAVDAAVSDAAGGGADNSDCRSRWNAAELRARIADAGRFNPSTIMPAYYKTDGLTRVAPALKGKPIFTAQQVEDVVAYLQTLK